MKKQAFVIGAMLAAGIAVAAVIVGMPSGEKPPVAAAESGFDETAGLEVRVQALEAAVGAEREARQLLEEELFILYEVIDELEANTLGESGIGRADTGPVETPTRGDAEGQRREGSFNARRNDIESRRAALVDAGFAPDRADWILQRESELRMEAMEARFEQMRGGEPRGPFDGLVTPDSLLRDEIGDADYEKYLDANNRPTSVNVRQVLESSPALSAGLQPGDRITHYDGERVFSTFDLTRQALEGESGENVVVNIVRDGAPMQVVMPRGPLGISTRRGR